MIKILELLEKSYPRPCTAGGLMKRVRLSNIDGEFSQIIRYLRETNKIIVVLVPENRMGIPTGRAELHKWLQKIDEITINPVGIDFLTGIKKLEIDERRTKAITKATIVLALVGFMQAVVFFKQFSEGINDSISWLMLCVMGVVLLIIFSLSWDSLSHSFGFRK